MKFLRLLFYILYVSCFLLVPIVLLFSMFDYSDPEEHHYALGLAFWAGVVIILYVFKYIVFKNTYEDLTQQVNNLKTNLYSETDNVKIKLISKKLHVYMILRDIWVLLLPAVILGMSYFAITVAQEGLLDLKSLLGWCILSWSVGFIFKVASDICFRTDVNKKYRHD